MTVTGISYDAGAVTLQAEAKRDADRILGSYWVHHLFPVDPARIARALGINVFETYLAEDVAGTLVKEAEKDPLILLNQADHPNRKRFTAAHEIGHFVKRADAAYEYVDRRDTLSSIGHVPDEIYANAFAANLLMPEDEVRRLDREGLGDAEMARRFGVSRDVMSFRRQNLGLQRP
jgi:Zn-dependent peptidase ImmA (M78 family)